MTGIIPDVELNNLELLIQYSRLLLEELSPIAILSANSLHTPRVESSGAEPSAPNRPAPNCQRGIISGCCRDKEVVLSTDISGQL